MGHRSFVGKRINQRDVKSLNYNRAPHQNARNYTEEMAPINGNLQLSEAQAEIARRKREEFQNEVSKRMGVRLLSAWTMLDSYCTECNGILMEKDNVKECIQCAVYAETQQVEPGNPKAAAELQTIVENEDSSIDDYKDPLSEPYEVAVRCQSAPNHLESLMPTSSEDMGPPQLSQHYGKARNANYNNCTAYQGAYECQAHQVYDQGGNLVSYVACNQPNCQNAICIHHRQSVNYNHQNLGPPVGPPMGLPSVQVQYAMQGSHQPPIGQQMQQPYRAPQPQQGGSQPNPPMNNCRINNGGPTNGMMNTGPVNNGGIPNGGMNNGGRIMNNGPIQNGPIQNGPMPNGPMPNGPMPNGPMHNGPMPNGPIHNGPMPNGPMHNGQVHNGQAHNGQVHNGQVHNGQVHNGQVHNGQVHNGPMHNGPIQNGPMHNVPMHNVPMHNGQVPMNNGGPHHGMMQNGGMINPRLTQPVEFYPPPMMMGGECAAIAALDRKLGWASKFLDQTEDLSVAIDLAKFIHEAMACLDKFRY